MTTSNESTLSISERHPHLALIKVILAALIFLLGLVSVLAPQRLASKEGAQHWFSLGNMAASGILLSGGLVHMLAESSEILDTGDFPISNFVAGLTFIGFMVLEESMHLIFMAWESTAEEDGEEGGGNTLREVLLMGHDHGHSHAHAERPTKHSHKHKEKAEENHSHHKHDHNHKEEKEENHSHDHKHKKEDDKKQEENSSHHQHDHNHKQDAEDHSHNHQHKDEHNDNHDHKHGDHPSWWCGGR